MTNPRPTTAIDKVANQYVTDMCEYSPVFATNLGRPGYDGKLPDVSPDGAAKLNDFLASTLATVTATPPQDSVDAVTIAAMQERLGLEQENFEAGDYKQDLNVLASPLQVRDVFDIMPTETKEHWSNIASRMQAIGTFFEGYQASLSQGIATNKTPAIRQVEYGIGYANDLAKDGSFFDDFAAQGSKQFPELASQLTEAAVQAKQAHGAMVTYLKDTLAPKARQEDAFGKERYSRASRYFLGSTIDLEETYNWGLEELNRIVIEQEKTVAKLYGPGISVDEAFERLDADESRTLHGTDALQKWMQTTSDHAVQALKDVHFDIPGPVQELECMIAPSTSGGIYYTGPSDDFSRPGRMWWSVPEGVETFGTWREKTTVYHEGVPGHHLQIGQTVYRKELLNDWRRQGAWVSGHGEGWALYAEELMAELGFLDDPADRLGMLDGQRLRAARVVLDIGVHLQLPTPSFLEGDRWNAENAWDFLFANVNMNEPFVRFELNRYLGWAGQAPSYKVGQRIWEQLRKEAETKAGSTFDLKAWHRTALDHGTIGLDVLTKALRNEYTI